MSTEKPENANPYRDTLFLPKTDFPMRGSLPQQEPKRLARWESEGMYRKLRDAAKGRTPIAQNSRFPQASCGYQWL